MFHLANYERFINDDVYIVPYIMSAIFLVSPASIIDLKRWMFFFLLSSVFDTVQQSKAVESFMIETICKMICAAVNVPTKKLTE